MVDNVLFGNGLGHTRHTRLCQCIVDLSSISMYAARTRDVDDVPGFAILDPKVQCRSSHNLERCGCVQVDDGVPLLVGHLVYNTVPCVSSIVDNNMDLATAKLCRFCNERLDVAIVEDVAHYCNGAATGFLDSSHHSLCLFYLISAGVHAT